MAWNHRSIVALLASVLMLALSAAIRAAEPLEKEQMQRLVAGKTVEGRNVYWKKGMIWFFHESGMVKKRDEYGNFGKGKWHVDNKGRLCTEFKLVEETCLAAVPRSDGGYDLYAEDGVHHWTFERFSPGNPHRL
jgi:hypothetical protein